MRRISMAMRDELVVALIERYARRGRLERGRILDEFTAVTEPPSGHGANIGLASAKKRGGEEHPSSAPERGTALLAPVTGDPKIAFGSRLLVEGISGGGESNINEAWHRVDRHSSTLPMLLRCTAGFSVAAAPSRSRPVQATSPSASYRRIGVNLGGVDRHVAHAQQTTPLSPTAEPARTPPCWYAGTPRSCRGPDVCWPLRNARQCRDSSLDPPRGEISLA
jgi:hypothetical protein